MKTRFVGPAEISLSLNHVPLANEKKGFRSNFAPLLTDLEHLKSKFPFVSLYHPSNLHLTGSLSMARVRRSRAVRRPSLAETKRGLGRSNHLVEGKTQNWQAVHKGRRYSNAKYRAFENKAEAFRYVREGSMSLGHPLPPPELPPSPAQSPSPRSSSLGWSSARRSPVALRTPTRMSRSSASSRSPTGRVSLSRSARNLGRPWQVSEDFEDSERLDETFEAISLDERLVRIVEAIIGDRKFQQVIEDITRLTLGYETTVAQTTQGLDHWVARSDQLRASTDYGDEEAEAVLNTMEQDH
ncbi:hypothetical protein FGADI_1953 [Fusarium gaditjirri]|uniref:Uncharacterized protein n=1 Tax=Fusarium gaditjirri TaxID=282569 RepID=A0A8H4X2M0_9HYPO|nr:hypothetical protein FGADI_1953 [Fusarium gaditjirri]